MGRKLQGRALVAKDGFSARYDLDRIKGVFSRPEHKLAGESYVGRVLVLDAAKGGVATAWMLYEMQSRGVMPAALVLNAVNPIMKPDGGGGETEGKASGAGSDAANEPAHPENDEGRYGERSKDLRPH